MTDRAYRRLAILFILLAAIFILPATAITGTAETTTSTAATPDTNELLGTMSVDFVDVGQGDAILVRAPSGRTLLVDAGSDRVGAGHALVEYMRRLGISRIDTMVITHAHDDHYGGLFQMFGQVEFGRILHGTRSSGTKYGWLEDAIAEHDIPYTYVAPGDIIDLGGGTRARVVSVGPNEVRDEGDEDSGEPEDDDRSRSVNTSSVVLHVSHGEHSFLLTGDATATTERTILAQGIDIRSTVYKAGHHGSRHSNTAEFVAAADSHYAVIQCGRNNMYGHPHTQAMSRIEAVCEVIYRTDINGTISFTTNGSTMNVTYGTNYLEDLLRADIRRSLYDALKNLPHPEAPVVATGESRLPSHR